MSRSYKRHLIIKDMGPHNVEKRFANHRVRKTLDIPSGRWYKRLFESYCIHDFVVEYHPVYGPAWKWRMK